ncbi:hypothetical protein F0562_017454 [Nyssa sinensis]|uniref:Uncharacterized protein n=1 Tax=Nyssa sinensis TaxID=561372 RepID=A0A5J4ZIW6_9ASTE|nr:hypothetical protein F0562_017454 [Nyssa sinensis]
MSEAAQRTLPALDVEGEIKLALDSKKAFEGNTVAQKNERNRVREVPADMVVNATLAAIAKHGADGKPGTNVYQIASSMANPLLYVDLTRSFYEHFKSSPCLDSKGRTIYVPDMKYFNSMEDFCSNLLRDAYRHFGLTDMTNQNGNINSLKLDNLCKKLVEHAKYLANLYEPYTFYDGR